MANNYTQFSGAITHLTEAEEAWLKAEIPGDLDPDELAPDELGFSYDFYKDGSGKAHLHLYSMEFGDLEAVAGLVQDFLARFRPDQCWSIEWAETCSTPRPGEFGGGAVLVTAEGQEWLSTRSWLSELLRQKNVIRITARGGNVVGVDNLPPGWDYEVADYDNCPNCGGLEDDCETCGQLWDRGQEENYD